MAKHRFGKHPPKHDYRTLRFKDYVSSVAPPPASFDVLAQVYQQLKINDPKTLFPMDGNDQYGDCTIAALAHAITTWCGMTGSKKIMAQSEVTKLYFHLTGGNDTGMNELDVLNYWRKNAVDKEKILSFAKIDPKNHTNVQNGIHLFGGVYLGFQVQENCEQDFEAGKPWTPGTLTNDGHAVYAVAYDATGVTVLTWGNVQKATWAWWDECVDECYAILPQEAAKTGFAPGFDFAQLKADLADVVMNA
jgi:hypothetical protein